MSRKFGLLPCTTRKSNTTNLVPDYYQRKTESWIVFPHELVRTCPWMKSGRRTALLQICWTTLLLTLEAYCLIVIVYVEL
jgi:hypothetical protein